jgi:hypothetical protein
MVMNYHARPNVICEINSTSSSFFLSFEIFLRENKEEIRTMFKTDRTVKKEIRKHENRVKGSAEITSEISSQIDKAETKPVNAINDMPLRLLNMASTASLAGVFLVNNLSFTQN